MSWRIGLARRRRFWITGGVSCKLGCRDNGQRLAVGLWACGVVDGEYEPLDGKGELVAARHALRNDVFILDPAGCEGLSDARDERIDDAGVPPRVDDGDAQGGA